MSTAVNRPFNSTIFAASTKQKMHYSEAPRLIQPDPPPKKTGRPTDYSPELGEKIVERIAGSVVSVRKLCESDPDFPSRASINRWRRKHPEFAEAYDMAMEGRVEDIRWDCVEIADEAARGATATVSTAGVDEDVKVRDDLAYVRLQIDTRQKLIASIAPPAPPAGAKAQDGAQKPDKGAPPLALPLPDDDPIARANENWGIAALPPGSKQ